MSFFLKKSLFHLPIFSFISAFGRAGVINSKVRTWRPALTPVSLRSCWLSTETGLIWSFLGPVCTIILVSKLLGAWVLEEGPDQGTRECQWALHSRGHLLLSNVLSSDPWFLRLPSWSVIFLTCDFFNATCRSPGRDHSLLSPLCFNKIGLLISSEHRCWTKEKVEGFFLASLRYNWQIKIVYV